jgi:hypothetical protein
MSANYCIFNTGNNTYNDNYTSGGTYNGKLYWTGSTNSLYIYYSTGSTQWCLSSSLGGSCFLVGKSPCSSTLPDFSSFYFSSGVCPTPTPTPTQNCSVLDFEAIFDCEIPNTPTPTPTNTATPTLTPTPTSSSVCSIVSVNASITAYTPTPSITPTNTPTTSPEITRPCNFTGNVNYYTIDDVINCPASAIFQDCYDGKLYYSNAPLSQIDGSPFVMYQIFLSFVDGVSRCISYMGISNEVSGVNNIVISSLPLGYSNLGQCNVCVTLESPSPTPTSTPTNTPTPSVTPTMTVTPTRTPIPTWTPTPTGGGISLSTCSVVYISGAKIYSYNLTAGTSTLLTVPGTTSGSDIAHTSSKLWTSSVSQIREWNITLSPFTATFNRNITLPHNIGTGLAAIDNTTLLTTNTTVSPNTVVTLDITTSTAVSTFKFNLIAGRSIAGDLLLTTDNKVITTTNGGGGQYLTQYDYSTGAIEADILISPTITVPWGIFEDGGEIYIMAGNPTGSVYHINNTSPYTITFVGSAGHVVGGASQLPECLTTSLVVVN